MDKYLVYKHTTPSGKVYIGITKRKAEERWLEGRGYKYNKHFSNAIKKYGWSNIEHEIITKGLNEEDAKEMERFFIQMYKSYDPKYGYNKTFGGDSVAIVVEKKILQYDLYGRLLKTFDSLTEASEKTKTNISRISDCANGKRFTTNGFIWLFEDDKEKEKKLKEKIKEKKHPSAMCGGANHQARAIEQYTIDGQYIKTFPSAQDAADELKIDYSSIKSAASIKNLRHKTSGGYIWIHEDEPNKKQIIEQAQNKGCEKPVSQYSLDGKHIRDFASIKEAMSFFNMKSNHISAVCDGKRKTSSGYIWKWKTA